MLAPPRTLGLVPALALALLAAGCVAPDDLTQASTQEAPPAPTPTPPPPAPTPQPVEPSPEPEPQPEQTPAPENRSSAVAPPPAPPAPAKPADHHAEQEDWVQPAPPERAMTVRMGFPVHLGAVNLTLRVVLDAVTPAAPLPVAPGNLTIDLMGPDGALLSRVEGAIGASEATLELSGMTMPGEHTAIFSIVGASDGQQAGERYRALVHVSY